MNIFLSYPLDPKDLAWPGEPTVKVRQATQIGVDGLPFNSFMSELPNHCGTHYDAPKHFNPNGPSINELPMEYFVFKNVLLLDIPKKACEGVTVEELKAHEDAIKKADLLLIRTGFDKVRKTSPEAYQMEGPFLTPETCLYMVNTFKDLKTVGFDFLAIGSPCNDLAAPAHQNLLGFNTEKFITAIEDMHLEVLGDKKINSVTAAPLRIVGLDSSQVSVIADIED
ncbi:cyclase family protein [uncultured Acetobacterium sp.]|uniref:cyclase family protein n=1 Tax=uncultured Acetobacterium sp. TaxID=217139 RepID=UPI0026009EA7|nr:cyclase family protein [uncultured Acetobacterium sp.]